MHVVPYPPDPNYGVTRDGRVFRLTDWSRRQRHIPQPPFQMATRPNTHGYLVVGKGKKTRAVHRMVAETFIPNPLGLPVVAHNDGKNRHNRKRNLRWTTQAGNLNDMSPGIHNTRARGEKFRHAKLTDKMVAEARQRRARGERLCDIVSDYPVDRSVLGRATQRRTWDHV